MTTTTRPEMVDERDSLVLVKFLLRYDIPMGIIYEGRSLAFLFGLQTQNGRTSPKAVAQCHAVPRLR